MAIYLAFNHCFYPCPTVAVFGGTAEYLALWRKQASHESYFYWHVMACIGASLLVFLTMRATHLHSRLSAE